MSRSIIGQNCTRIGAEERVVGEALFAADVHLPGALTLAAVRSDRPHARIIGVDTARARTTRGCVAVFTAADVPGRNRFGIISKDQPLLADDKVRFVGDPVALVAAETKDAALAAANLVEVVYEDLPAVFDPEAALRSGAPLIHEHGNRLGGRYIEKGAPEKAFAHADVVIERVYLTSMIEHSYLEPDAGAAYVDDTGVVVIYAGTQNPHYDRADTAALLGLDESKVRIIQCATGGGFGSKLDLGLQGFLGLAALKLKRPVRMVYSREEAFLSTSKRHPLRIRFKSGATRDGRLIAADVFILADTGAYASYGLAVVSRSAIHAVGPYEVPNVRIESLFAHTNNPTCGAMRGFGVPQTAFAHEAQMDILAAELGIDPIEFRLRNCLRVGSLTTTSQELTAGVGIRECLDHIKAPYASYASGQTSTPYILRGRGVAAMLYGVGNTGQQNPSSAQIELTAHGEIVVYTGAADIGQGSTTALAQIAAQELGVLPDSLKLVVADTGRTTSAGATSASRQTYISGNAVLEATRRLKDTLIASAADMLKTHRAGLDTRDYRVFDSARPDKGVGFAEIAARLLKLGLPLTWHGYFDPDTTPLDPDTGKGRPYGAFAFAAQTAEVEVNTLTGEVKCLRLAAAHDVGRAVNPQMVHGQVFGGAAMGLGFALMEEYVPGATESFKDYHIPTCADIPEFTSHIVEEPEPSGPFGAKGVGEPALIPTAPAILNAIADALGERIYELPANLERTLKAAKSKRSQIMTALDDDLCE